MYGLDTGIRAVAVDGSISNVIIEINSIGLYSVDKENCGIDDDPNSLLKPKFILEATFILSILKPFYIVCLLAPSISPIIINIYNDYFLIDLVFIRNSITLIDKVCLIQIIGLFIGIMGTVAGHELTHRKKNKLDMFFGNWLLAISWDCAFAIEHVYGHHKNVCLDGDPATAKRGENVYAFILRAIILVFQSWFQAEIISNNLILASLP